MKLKNLRKKIRQLEARLQEGPKKLAKLKRKLDAMAAAKARKTQKKAVARQTVKSSTPTLQQNSRLTPEPRMKSRSAKKPGAAKKTKGKLNLSPERRAQLAAAMKARWAAKRAAAEANPRSASIAQDVALGQGPPSP
jgi:hypothetical protein